MQAARASSARSSKRPLSADGSEVLEENDVLRMRILRERGRATLIQKVTVDDNDFEEVLRKEGVGANLDLSQQGSFVERPAFDMVIGAAIMLNSIVLGLEIDLSEQTDPMLWLVLENVFCVIWLLELMLKLWFLRLRYFRDTWNWLDLGLVFLSVYDAWIAPFALPSNMKMDLGFLRVIRVLRLLRLVKLIRVIKMSRNLWLLVQGFIESFSTLSWVSFLIFFVIYAYSALFRIVVDCGKDYSGWSDCSMMFGTMPKAMYTLFQVLTLESWSMIISRPLMDVHPVLFVAIISFILLTTFGLLNIIVGVVVENTLSVAKQNMDLQSKRGEKKSPQGAGAPSNGLRGSRRGWKRHHGQG